MSSPDIPHIVFKILYHISGGALNPDNFLFIYYFNIYTAIAQHLNCITISDYLIMLRHYIEILYIKRDISLPKTRTELARMTI